LLPLRVMLSYLVLPCQRTLGKCFTSSSRLFRWDLMLKNVRDYTMFLVTQSLRKWRDQRPNKPDDLNSSITVRGGGQLWESITRRRICFRYIFVP
jgi:hypothetical protein